MKQANELMKIMDMDCSDIWYEQEFVFNAKDQDVSNIKEKLKEVFENDELEVFHIEGGKVE